MAEQYSSGALTPEDLEDPKLANLNMRLQFIMEKLAAMEGAAGPHQFRTGFSAPDIRMSQNYKPTDDNQVLTIGEAKRRYGAGAVRDAFANRWDGSQVIRGLPSTVIEATPLPGPVTGAITDPVDETTDPIKSIVTGTWVLPDPFNDFNGCEVWIVSDPLGTPTEPQAVGHQWHDPTDTVGPYAYHLEFPRPYVDTTWRIFFCSRNASGANVLVTAAGADQSPYVDVSATARPATLTACGQLTGLGATIAEYGAEPTTQKPICRVNITWSEPGDADDQTSHAFWIYETDNTVSVAPDSANFVLEAEVRYDSAAASTNIWRERPDQGDPDVRLWIRAVTNDEGWRAPPDNSSTVTYVDIDAPNEPAQVTGFSVSLVDKTTVLENKAFRYSYTRPSDPEFFHASVERIACDASYTPIAGAVWSFVAGIGSHATAGVPTYEDQGLFPLPPANEYWTFRARSVSRAGIENYTSMPTDTLLVPASTGFAKPDQVTGLSAVVAEYGADKNTYQPIARIRVSWTEPGDAGATTGHHIWTKITTTAIGTVPDASEFEIRAARQYSASEHYIDMWVVRPEKGAATDRYWIRVVTANDAWYAGPDNSSPSTYVDVSAPSGAAQVTGFAVAYTKVGGGSSERTISYTYTRPSDPEFFVAAVERIWCDASYTPLSGEVWHLVATIGGNATAGVSTTELQSVHPAPPSNEYFKFRARSVSRAGLYNDVSPPTVNVLNPVNDSDLSVDGSGNVSIQSSAGGMTMDWNTSDGLKVSSTAGLYAQIVNGTVAVRWTAAYTTKYATMDATSAGGLVSVSDGTNTWRITASSGLVHGGSSVIDNNDDADLNRVLINGTEKIGSSGQINPRKLTNPSVVPTMSDGELAVWYDSTSGLYYLVFQASFGVQRWVLLDLP